MGGYDVEPGELRSAAGDIAKAIGAADDTNLEDVSGKEDSYGHGKVASAVANFCTTWELAKQILQQRSASAGETLNGAAGTYEKQEQHEHSTFGGGGPQPSPSPGPAPTAPGGP